MPPLELGLGVGAGLAEWLTAWMPVACCARRLGLHVVNALLIFWLVRPQWGR